MEPLAIVEDLDVFEQRGLGFGAVLRGDSRLLLGG